MTLESLRAVFEIATPLFLIMDPVGNSTLCLALLAGLSPGRQRVVIGRELLFALATAVGFFYLGEALLGMLDIHQSTLRVAGGLILFVIAMRMVFPTVESEVATLDRDPFFVPIAVPLIAGPSLLAAVMLYAHRAQGEGERAVALAGLVTAWMATAALMLAAPTLTRLLGPRGLRAAERLMGLILILLAVQMLEDGVRMFVTGLAG